MNRDAQPESKDYLEKALSAAFPRRSDSGCGPSLLVPPDPVEDPEVTTPPERLGRYPVAGVIGRGGMGIIYRVIDPDLRRDSAIKILRRSLADDREMCDRFLQEARICGGLQHPGIVPVHEVGRLEDGRPYFTMKIVEGRTLADLLHDRQGDERDVPRFLEIFEKVGQALAYAHDRGVVHGDVKPHNVMVGEFGETQLMDWGFAQGSAPGLAERALDDSGSDSSRAWGTPSYMAPEQARGGDGSCGPRIDVFGLGALLCEILTGAPPHVGETRADILLKASQGWLDEAYERLRGSGADPVLVDLAIRCLQVEPDDRPAGAAVVAHEVRAHQASLEERARQSQLEAEKARAVASQERRARRLTLGLAVSIVAAILVAAVGLFVVASERRERSEETRRAVTDAMNRAELLRAESRFDPDRTPERWQEILGAARQAVAFARTRQADRQLERAAVTLLETLESEKAGEDRDRRVAARLETLRPHLGDDRLPMKVEAEYVAAFQEYGIDVDGDRPADSAERISSSPIRAVLLASLDDWAHLRRAENATAAWQRPLEICLLADANPWRTELRRAILAEDRQGLLDLAAAGSTNDVSPESLGLLARCLSESEALEQAIELLRAASVEHPNDFWIHHDLACQLGTLKPAPHDEIARLLWMTVAIRPTDAHALTDLGLALYSLREADARHLEEAGRVLARAVELDPESGRAHFMRGYVLGTQGLDREALASYEAAVQRGFVMAYPPLIEHVCGEGYFEDAIVLVDEARKWLPQYSKLDWMLAASLVRLGRFEEALAPMERALKLEPNLALAQYDYGHALIEVGRFVEGREWLHQGLDSLRQQGGQANAAHAAAVRGVDLLISVEPRVRQVHAGGELPTTSRECSFMGGAALRLNLPETSLRLYRRALEVDPGIPEQTGPGYLYSAARAALQVGLAEEMDTAQRLDHLRQARVWLTGEVEVWRTFLAVGRTTPLAARPGLATWKYDGAIGPLIAGQYPDELPQDEQQRWRDLANEWSELLTDCEGEGWSTHGWLPHAVGE